MYTKLFDSDKGNMLCTTTPQNSAWNMLSQVVDGEPVSVMCVCFVSLPTMLCTCVLSLYLRCYVRVFCLSTYASVIVMAITSS